MEKHCTFPVFWNDKPCVHPTLKRKDNNFNKISFSMQV